MEFSVLAIDVAKEVFQLQGISRKGGVSFKRRVRRDELLCVLRGFSASRVVLEAGWSAHYWAREIGKLGHKVQLIAPQHVKPYVKTNKSDRSDVDAICEAALRPEMKFVGVKTIDQQDIQALHRVRSRYVRQRTSLSNEIRGFLAEHGIVFRLGIKAVREKLRMVLVEAPESFSRLFRDTLVRLESELRWLDSEISHYDRKIGCIADSHPICERLQEMKGVGPLVATAMLCAVGEPERFRNGRAFAANLGLVPRHWGTGGRTRLGSMSKRGDVYIRQLLIHGARSALRTANKRADKQSLWSLRVMERAGFNKAVVALANKNARIIWKLMTTDSSYNSNLAAA